MLCDNCKKNEANIRYSEIINGVKKELNLCDECSKKLGLQNIGINWDISLPIDFSSFFGGFIENFDSPEFMPLFNEIKELKCKNCNSTLEDIANKGRLWCAECYTTFESKLDPIIKKIQGSNIHTGRIGKILENKIEKKADNDKSTDNSNELEKLKIELKKAIKDERYEDAAKLRDKIKEIEGE